MTLTPRRRPAVLTLCALGLSGALAACGGGATTASTTSVGGSAPTSAPSTTSSSSMGTEASYPPVTPGPAATGAHNAADVAFAEGMIPHHGQAVAMSDMILRSGRNAEVKSLATAIKAAQSPEIATMSGWLKGWGTTPPDPYGHAMGMPGMSHGGMMSAEQMQQFSQASGSTADRMFLTMMIQHHEGAVTMAQTELADGANAQAKKLAQHIITSQQAEIATMKRLLTTLG